MAASPTDIRRLDRHGRERVQQRTLSGGTARDYRDRAESRRSDTASEYNALFRRAQLAYLTKLWNGKYFDYDTRSEYRSDIMAEQLAGQWYANLTGLGDLVPKRMRLSSLKTVYNNNVMLFGNGQMGAGTEWGQKASRSIRIRR